MIRKFAVSGLMFIFFLGLGAFSVQGAHVNSGARAGQDINSASGDVEITADQLEYQSDKKLMTGRGNVVVTYGEDSLRADYMTVQTDTQEAHAIGNVVFERDGQTWRGEEVVYNFKTHQGDFGEFTAYADPYYIKAEDSKRISPEVFQLKNLTLSTCKGPHPEYHISAREAQLINEEKVVARSVTLWLGPVPIFHVPKWTKDVGKSGDGFEFVPGYSSKMGAYLLTAYNYRLNPAMTAATHLDLRSKRGVAVGQDISWGDPELSYNGEFNAYYANDSSPLEGLSDEEIADYGDLVTGDRYRFRLSDVRYFTPRDYLITELNYLSDPAVIQDFFDDEFRDGVQPENRVSLTHRDDYFTAALQVNHRLNDFYENVNRTPEASLDVSRMKLGDSPLYYASDNAAAYLEKEFPERRNIEKYDALRADTDHMLYYPTRNFGFLNLIPRGGYHGTYYSKTYENETRTNVLSLVDSNGVSSITNEVVSSQFEEGADLRNLFELGLETSFKAFGVWTENWIGRDDRGLRHVFEPYADYTYVPEPDLKPENLPQFDDIDKLGKRNDVLIGMRNKLQTRRRKVVHDLVNVNIWSTYRVEKEPNENDFSDIFFDTELRLVDWMAVDFDGSVNTYENELSTFNTQVGFITPNETRLTLEYRYKPDTRNQVSGELTLFPNAKWSFKAYERYSFEESTLQENSYFIQYKSSCLGYGLGYKQIDDDMQVWFQIWVLAFPKSAIKIGI